MSEWQWHQLGHMQVFTLLQTDNHTSTPSVCFYRPDALPAAQRTGQSTEGKRLTKNCFLDQLKSTDQQSGSVYKNNAVNVAPSLLVFSRIERICAFMNHSS